MQILAFINFAAAIQGLFLGYLLINRRFGQKEHRLLAVLLIAMSLAILGSVLGISGYYRQLPHLIRVADPLVFLFGPLLYFYITAATRKKLSKGFYWHLLPFFLYLLATIPFYLLSAEEKIQFGEDMFINQRKNQLVSTLQTVRTLHIVAYVLASLVHLKRYKSIVKQNFSSIDQFHLDRAAFFLRLFLGLMVIATVVYLISLTGAINLIITNNLISLAMGLIIYSFAYSSWNTVLPDKLYTLEDEKISKVTAGEADKSRNSYNLSDEQYIRLQTKLVDALENQKLYLESNFSLTELSNEIGVMPYITSELISRHYQNSFFDVINGFRVEEVKRRLNDTAFSHYNILGVALECGFSSKSSFNAAFKKFTGKTPSFYRESMMG